MIETKFQEICKQDVIQWVEVNPRPLTLDDMESLNPVKASRLALGCSSFNEQDNPLKRLLEDPRVCAQFIVKAKRGLSKQSLLVDLSVEAELKYGKLNPVRPSNWNRARARILSHLMTSGFECVEWSEQQMGVFFKEIVEGLGGNPCKPLMWGSAKVDSVLKLMVQAARETGRDAGVWIDEAIGVGLDQKRLDSSQLKSKDTDLPYWQQVIPMIDWYERYPQWCMAVWLIENTEESFRKTMKKNSETGNTQLALEALWVVLARMGRLPRPRTPLYTQWIHQYGSEELAIQGKTKELELGFCRYCQSVGADTLKTEQIDQLLRQFNPKTCFQLMNAADLLPWLDWVTGEQVLPEKLRAIEKSGDKKTEAPPQSSQYYFCEQVEQLHALKEQFELSLSCSLDAMPIKRNLKEKKIIGL